MAQVLIAQIWFEIMYLLSNVNRLLRVVIFSYGIENTMRILLLIILCTLWNVPTSFAKEINVGMYGVWAWPNKAEAFKMLSDNKFNLASGVGSRDHLDKAHRFGVKCLVGTDIKLTKDIANDPERWIVYLDAIKKHVNQLKNHPAVFAWYFVDEPSWHQIPVGKLKELNAMIKALDTNHPIYTVLSTPDSWLEYMPLFDIIGIDPYLKSSTNSIDGTPMIVKKWIQKIKSDVSRLGGKKPEIWAVVGAFEEKPKLPIFKSQFRKPTPREFVQMIDYAMEEQVDGIMIWTLGFKHSSRYEDWYLPYDDPSLWEVVRNTPNRVSNK